VGSVTASKFLCTRNSKPETRNWTHLRGLRVLCGGICLFLSSCNQRPRGVDLIIINGAEPQTLDPALHIGQIEGRIVRELFEGLCTRDARGQVQPGMAERWDISPDGTRYTFHLRPGIRWTNGDPVTARDFERSWLRVLDPQSLAEYAYILYFIKNAESYHKGQITDPSAVGIRALDDRTLQVDLIAPTPFFASLTAFPTYSPVHLPSVQVYGEAWVKPAHIVTNGPYRMLDWRINDRVSVVKNPSYWNAGAVDIPRVDFLAVTKSSTAFNLYATGQADLILDKGLIPASLLDLLQSRPDCHTYTYLGTFFFRFNCTRPPFDDPRVRAAFTAALDRQRIVTKITRASEKPAASFTPPGIPGYDPPPGIDYDPARARLLLADAGFSGGKGFPNVSILYNKTELNESIAVEVQAIWQETLGVHVELRNQEWASYLNSLKRLDFDIARSSWVGDYLDPNTFLDCFITNGGNNNTGWSNARYDALIAAANREPDPARRMQIFREAETLLLQEGVPFVPVYFYAGVLFYDPARLSGIEPNPLAEHPVRDMRLTP
jgi:oligopeptide transport system substrate-binding protein